MANTYDLGDLTILTVAFVDGAGVAVDVPLAEVTCTVRARGGAADAYTEDTDPGVSRTGTGTFRLDYRPAAAGDYTQQWATDGTYVGAETGTFSVRLGVA